MLRRRLRERARFVGRLGRYQPLEVPASATGLDPIMPRPLERVEEGYGGLDLHRREFGVAPPYFSDVFLLIGYAIFGEGEVTESNL